MDLHDDLARFDSGEFDIDDGQPPPTIDGQPKANRLLGVIRNLDRLVAEVKEVADSERDRIARWEEERTDMLVRRRAHLLGPLEQFMRAHHAATNAVSLVLPNGTLKLPINQPSVQTADQAQATAWLVANGYHAAVDYPPAPAARPVANEVKKLVGKGKPLQLKATGNRTDDGKVLHQLVAEGGEVVPGIYIARMPDERGFDVKLAAQPDADG